VLHTVHNATLQQQQQNLRTRVAEIVTEVTSRTQSSAFVRHGYLCVIAAAASANELSQPLAYLRLGRVASAPPVSPNYHLKNSQVFYRAVEHFKKVV